MATWLFHRATPSKTAGGDAVRNTFEGKEAPTILARESIQNSVDAAVDESALVTVKFVELQLDYGRLPFTQDFWAFLQAGHPRRGDLAEIRRKNSPALCVEDYNTTGLPGPPHDIDSRMFRLMGELGGTKDLRGQGGAYGYGKAVYILSGELFTFFAFTVVDGKPYFFGSSFQDRHASDTAQRTGLAWFCADGSEEDVPLAIEGAEALRIAKALGIPRALDPDLKQGTSILIPYHSVDLDTLEQQVVRSWWPRMIDKRLNVVVRRGGHSDRLIQPNNDPVAKHYIPLYQRVTTDRQHLTKDDGYSAIQHRKEELGWLLLGEMKQNGNGSDENSESEFRHGIALIRGPRMVVRYYAWSRSRPRDGIIGVFVASDSANRLLQKAEPPAHDDWGKTGRLSQGEFTFVKAVKDGIRKAYGEFDKAFVPSTDGVDLPAVIELRRFFGDLVASPGKVKPPQQTEPISIQNRRSSTRSTTDGRLVAKAEAEVHYRGAGPAMLKVGCRCYVLQSGLRSQEDLWPIRLVVQKKLVTPSPTAEPDHTIKVSPGDMLKLEVETEPYEPFYLLNITFQAEVEGAVPGAL